MGGGAAYLHYQLCECLSPNGTRWLCYPRNSDLA
jgi:hypothetical protein